VQIYKLLILNIKSVLYNNLLMQIVSKKVQNFALSGITCGNPAGEILLINYVKKSSINISHSNYCIIVVSLLYVDFNNSEI